MIAVSPQSVAPDLLAPEKLNFFLDKLNQSIHKFGNEKGVRSDQNVKYVMEKFHLKEEDVKEWMKGVSYPQSCQEISRKTLEETVKELKLAGVIPNSLDIQIVDLLVNQQVAKVTE